MPGERIQSPVDIGFYDSPSGVFARQECVGLFPYNPITKNASTPGGLLQTHGIEDWATISGAGATISDAIMHKGELFVASYLWLYKISSDATATKIGDLPGIFTRPQLATNGEVLCVLCPEDDDDSAKVFFYDAIDGFRESVDAVLADYIAQDGGILSVTSGNGKFFMCTKKTLFHSSLVDDADRGTSFPALAFASGERRPDDNVAVEWIRGELYLFGDHSYEPWRDVGSEPFAMARIDGAVQDKGLRGVNSVVEADNTFFFVGGGLNEGPAVWRHTGGPPQKISTAAIDKLLEEEGSTYNSRKDHSWSYSIDGHAFIGFRPNTGDLAEMSIVCDLTASALQARPVWHRRSGVTDDYPVYCMLTGYGKTLVAGGTFSEVGVLSSSENAVFGNRVTRTFTGAYLQNQGESLSLSEVRLRAEAGVGLSGYAKPEADSEPSVLLEYSLDFGNTWISKGSRSLGKSGEYGKILVWRRFGRIPNMALFRFTVETMAYVAFQDLHFIAKGGVS